MTKPVLHKKSEFEDVLKNYKASEETLAHLAGTRLVVLTSPTSAGRNTLIQKVVETGKYRFVVSDTTRPKRKNNGVWEEDGGPYWFKTEDQFLEGLKQGRYVEAELIHNQQVSGVSIEEIEKAAAEDKIAITEVDYAGVPNYIAVKPDTVAILVLPPDPDEWMRRLSSRGDMDTEEIRNRLVSAEKILESAYTRDYMKILINDDIEAASMRMMAMIENNDYSEDEHEHAQAVAWKLLGYVKQQLHS